MADWRNFGEVLLGSFASQVARWGEEGIAAYVTELEARGLSPDEAIAALRAHSGEFPPSAGNLVAAVERLRQGAPPDYMTAMRLIASKVTLIDYFEPTKGFDRFIEALAGEHEAVARFALSQGPRGVREMPDPTTAQDTGGSTAMTRNERSYRQATKEWEEDPTQGVALEEARRIALPPAPVAAISAARRELQAGEDG